MENSCTLTVTESRRSALSELSIREEHIQNLLHELKHELELHAGRNVPYDGDCLLHSILASLLSFRWLLQLTVTQA